MSWRWLRSLLGLPSPSTDYVRAARRVSIQPPRPGGNVFNPDALRRVTTIYPTPDDAGRRLQAAMTPSNTHSPEQETTTMTAYDMDAPDNPVAPPPHPDTVEAHVVDLWERDMLHLILRGSIPGSGPVYAMARPGIGGGTAWPPMELNTWWYVQDDTAKLAHPGVILRRDDAVTLAHAILQHTGAKTPTERELADLRDTADTLATELTDARHQAVTNAQQATGWQALAVEKDATLDAIQRHLDTMHTVAAEQRERADRVEAKLERLEAPALLVPGNLEETTEEWHPAQGMLHAVPDDNRSALYERAQELAQEVQEARDAHARAEAEAARLARENDDLTTEVHRLRGLANLVHSKAMGRVVAERARQKSLGWTEEHDDHHGMVHFADLIQARVSTDMGREQFTQVAALAVAALERIDRRQDSSTPVEEPVEQDPEAPLGATWTTAVGDTWEHRRPVGGAPRYVLTVTKGDPYRLGAVHYVTGAAITPESLDAAATAWALSQERHDDDMEDRDDRRDQ